MNVSVRENSDEKLKLVLKPTGCLYVGAGLLLIVAGLWVIWMIGKQIELSVADQILHYRNSRLGLLVNKEFSIATADVTAVTLDLKEGFSPTYKVTLHTAESIYQADLPLSDGDEKRAIVDKLQQAVAQPNGSFEHEESGIIGALLLGGACVAGGLVCLLALQTVSLTANRTIGYLQIRRRRQLLPFGNLREFDLADFKRIEAKKVTVRNPSGQSTSSYQVLVHHKGGKPLAVAHGPMFTEASAKEVIDLVDGWMEAAAARQT